VSWVAGAAVQPCLTTCCCWGGVCGDEDDPGLQGEVSWVAGAAVQPCLTTCYCWGGVCGDEDDPGLQGRRGELAWVAGAACIAVQPLTSRDVLLLGAGRSGL